nr:CoA transferase [Candidatus Desulfatibia profunda]
AAIHWRETTGLGTMIEFSQVQAATRCLGYTTPMYGRFGIVRQRWGNWDTQLSVHGIILCGKSDFPDVKNPQDKHDARYVMVSAFQDADFKELCAITGMKDLYNKYKAHKDRVEAETQVEIYAALERWAEDKSRSQVVKILQDAGLLAEPVMNDREVYECDHYRQRGTIRWLDDPIFGDVLTQSGYSSGLMSKSPRRQNWIWRPVGADNVKIYHELLGYPTATIEEWYNKSWI